MALLPWKRLKHKLFGVNHQGVFSVDPKSGEVCFGYIAVTVTTGSKLINSVLILSFQILFLHRFSDIHDGRGGDGIIHLVSSASNGSK